MKDPHPPLNEVYPDVDLTQRVPRTADWDDQTLDDYPTQDIMPVCLSDTSELGYAKPSGPKTIAAVYSRWIHAICKATVQTDYEHACNTDAYGNIYGVLEDRLKDEPGGPFDADIQRGIERTEYRIHNQMFIHTHPRAEVIEGVSSGYSSGFSLKDLEMLLTRCPPASHMSFIPVTDKLTSTKLFTSYVYEDEEQKSNMLPKECISEPEDILYQYDKELTEVTQHLLSNGSNTKVGPDMFADIKLSLDIMSEALELSPERLGLGVISIRIEDGLAVPDENAEFDTPLEDVERTIPQLPDYETTI